MTPRGACPTLWEPMPTGDGLLVRVKPAVGRLTASQARLVADASARCGSGVVELTGRGNLQIRGLRPDTAGAFARAIVQAGLGHPDPEVERRRNVACSPLNADAARVAADLDLLLVAADGLAALPPKFGFAVNGDPALHEIGADIVIRLGTERCDVGAEGGTLALQVVLARAAEVALDLARAFLRLRDGHRRMRDLIASVGEHTVLSACGLRPVARVPAPTNAALPIGRLPDGFGVGVPFGALRSADLARLADAAEYKGRGTLLLTPWRVVVLPGVPDPAALAGLDLITDPADPRLRITICPGQPSCASATVATRGMAVELAGLALAGTVHVSGCVKGCAHPGPATLTLVGRDERFDLVREGRAGDPPVRRGLTGAEVLAEAAA
jgi:precorrin-3B synthase